MLQFNPFMERYLTLNFEDGSCAPTGTTGEWWAVSGHSDGYEQWSVDLSKWSGKAVEVALTVATDDLFTFGGIETTTSPARAARARRRSSATAT